MNSVFAHLANYFESCGMNPAEYKITITPLSIDAEAQIKAQYVIEKKKQHPFVLIRFHGFINGIPFEIEDSQ